MTWPSASRWVGRTRSSWAVIHSAASGALARIRSASWPAARRTAGTAHRDAIRASSPAPARNLATSGDGRRARRIASPAKGVYGSAVGVAPRHLFREERQMSYVIPRRNVESVDEVLVANGNAVTIRRHVEDG